MYYSKSIFIYTYTYIRSHLNIRQYFTTSPQPLSSISIVKTWPSKLSLLSMPILSLLAYGAADFNAFCYAVVVVALVEVCLSVLWSGISVKSIANYGTRLVDTYTYIYFLFLFTFIQLLYEY